MDNIDNKSYNLIEAYINGTLDEAQRIAVEQRLKEDPLFKDWHDWINNSTNDLTAIEAKSKKMQAKAWLEDDRIKPSETNHNSNYPKYFVAILALILGSIFIYLTIVNRPKKAPQQLVAIALESPYKSPVVLRNTDQTTWSSIIPLYENKEYNRFTEKLSPIINNGQSTAEQRFYFAISYLFQERNECETATPLFQSLVNKRSGFMEQALWYRSLSNINCNELEAAKADLMRLIELGNYKKEEAKELLESLEEIR